MSTTMNSSRVLTLTEGVGKHPSVRSDLTACKLMVSDTLGFNLTYHGSILTLRRVSSCCQAFPREGSTGSKGTSMLCGLCDRIQEVHHRPLGRWGVAPAQAREPLPDYTGWLTERLDEAAVRAPLERMLLAVEMGQRLEHFHGLVQQHAFNRKISYPQAARLVLQEL